MPLIAQGVQKDHVIREIVIVVDDVGEIGGRFATFVSLDCESCVLVVHDVNVGVPVRKVLRQPGCVVTHKTGDDYGLASCIVS